MEGKEIIKEEVLELSKNYNSSFHNHTEVSLGDGVTTAEQLVKRAVEIGAEVIGVSVLCFGCILFLGIFCIFYTSFLIPDAKDQQQNQTKKNADACFLIHIITF